MTGMAMKIFPAETFFGVSGFPVKKDAPQRRRERGEKLRNNRFVDGCIFKEEPPENLRELPKLSR